MSGYYITCCSTVDLPKDVLEKNNIPYVSFSYILEGEEFEDDLYQSITPHDFFTMIEEGAMPTTSQVSPEKYIDLWTPILEDGKRVIHLTLSSGISGTYQSAIIAKSTVEDKYGKNCVEVIDSLSASSGYGLLVIEAKLNADKGMSFEDNVKWIEDNKKRLHHWFFSTDLTSFIRGGRVSKVSGFFGTMLNICPLLNVNCEGKLIPREKNRGKKKAISQIVNKMKRRAVDGENYSGKVYISNSDCFEDARAVADACEEIFKSMDGKVEIFDIGTVIGSHTGPGTVALFFWGDEREL